MRGQIAFAVIVLVLAWVPLQAQMQTTSVAFNATGPVGGAVVKDAPYSAEVVTTYDRVLANGGNIHGETHGKVYRDSQGRTRTETEALAANAAPNKSVFIQINDPVKRSVISLDPSTMTARVMPWPFPSSAAAGMGTARAVPPAQTPDSAKGSSPASAETATTVAGAAPGTFAATGVRAGQAQLEDLGAREMEGLTVAGSKTTRSLSPAIEGGGPPRTFVTRTWVSSELKIAVLTETEDAQSGHRATRLVNIVRTEPDSTLFQIPSGYTVAENRTAK